MMTLDEMRQHEWVVNWSGGKDSTATIILMHENKVPIKKIIYVRMMYDDELPATLPIMTEFVDRAKLVFEDWGYEVEVVPSAQTAKQQTEIIFKRSKYPERNGKKYGILPFMAGSCRFAGIKIETCKNLCGGGYQMIGYAADEIKRIHRLTDERQSIMVVLGIKEQETFDICRKYDLLSPLYDLNLRRDGCWFCPNAAKNERAIIKRDYPELYEKIIEMIEMCEYDFNLISRNKWLNDYLKEKNQLSFDFKEEQND